MAEEFATGKRVQAIDELGRWSTARVIAVVEEGWTVSFPGYPGCDRDVNSGEIRLPIPPLAEQERRKGCTTEPRNSHKVASDQLKRFMIECQRGDEVETLQGKGIIHVVDPFNKTFDLADGSSASLNDIVFPAEETEIERPPVKRRRRMTSLHANGPNGPNPEEMSSSCSDSTQQESSCDLSADTKSATNWPTFRVGNYQCGKLYEIKGLSLTVVPHLLDLCNKTATCWPVIAEDLDQDTTITVPVEKLSDSSSQMKGPLKKKCASLANDVFTSTLINFEDTCYRKEFRRMQVSSALFLELKAAFRSRMRRKNFDLGLISMDIDTDYLKLDVPNTWTMEYSYRKDNLADVDTILGPKWDVSMQDGLTRFVTSIKLRVTPQFTISGVIKVADFDGPLDIDNNSYRAVLKEHMCQH